MVRRSFPEWATFDGCVTMHRCVFQGLYIGSARVPSLDWFPERVRVIDLRDGHEALPERVGDPYGVDREVLDLAGRSALDLYQCQTLQVDERGVPLRPSAYSTAVQLVEASLRRGAVVLVSRDGLVRAPLVAFGVLRRMGLGLVESVRRVAVMPGEGEQQSPSSAALAWAEVHCGVEPGARSDDDRS